MSAVLWLVLTIIDLFVFLIIVNVILSWLVFFNVINLNNRFVYLVYDTTNKLLAPLLNPIRRILPDFGGIDISPVVLMLLLFFLSKLIVNSIAPSLGVGIY